MPENVKVLQAMVRNLMEQVGELSRRNKQLEHQLHLHLAYRYGPRAESLPREQRLLFEVEPEGPPAAQASAIAQAEAAPAPQPVASLPGSSRPSGRQRLPKDLPRVRREYALVEEDRICPDCKKVMGPIGEDRSEQLEYKPADLFVIEHVRLKYACSRCQSGVLTGPKPAQPIEKGLPGPGLLAQAVVSKYADHLPLYRQEKIYARHGVELSRKTLRHVRLALFLDGLPRLRT